MMKQNEMTLRHQNIMLAVRVLMGWPTYKPANDAIAFCSGREVDVQVGTEVARIAQTTRKDIVYSAWPTMTARLPASFAIGYRTMHTVDIVDDLVPWVANDTAPLLFVNRRADESFGIDERGSLVRLIGKPKSIAAGRKLAMRRIKAAAARMGDELLPTNRHVPNGATWIHPDSAMTEVVANFR